MSSKGDKLDFGEDIPNSKVDQIDQERPIYMLNNGEAMTQDLKPTVTIEENDGLLAVGASHRKIANPLPLGAWSFATTIMLFSLYNLKVQDIQVQSAILTMSIFLGGFVQYLSGLWEFASGNTFGGE